MQEKNMGHIYPSGRSGVKWTDVDSVVVAAQSLLKLFQSPIFLLRKRKV